MVGKLNVSKNQYTKSITIPPVVKADSPSSTTSDSPVASQPTQNTVATPTKIDSVTSNTNNENKNKSTSNTTKDESLIVNKTVEVEFPSVSFEPISFGNSEVESSDDSFVLPNPPKQSEGEYAPISGVKQRSVNSNSQGENTVLSNPTSKEVHAYSTDSEEKDYLSVPYSNSGISIVVHGDNATITVTNSSDATLSSDGNNLPTLKDIKNATSLEALQLIEERYSETIKYLEAKKLVLDTENKIN